MPQKVVISCDSTADLPKELVEKYEINIVPTSIIRDSETLLDGVNIQQADIFEYKERTGKLIKTCAPNIAECDNVMRRLKAIYGDDCAIVHFDISSDMSSTYSNFVAVSRDYSDVFIVDSRNLSAGIGLLVLHAADLRDKGMSAKAIFDNINETKKRVDGTFVLDTLDYLYKGGRCSGVAALGANLLKLKPRIEVRNGVMVVGKKYRGKINDVFLTYVDEMLDDIDNIELDRIFIPHTVIPEHMDYVKKVEKLIRKKMPFKEIIQARAGCSVSVHCGPDTLGVMFIRKSNVDK